jgi:hypothetical protein
MLSREVCEKCGEYEGVFDDNDWVCYRAGDMADEEFWVCENSQVPKWCVKIFEHAVARGVDNG